jgi:hypothetical protein
MAWGVTAVAGATLVGGALASNAAKSAASKQAGAAKDAASAQLAQFNTINDQQAPYRQAGYGALGQLNNYLGIESPKAGLNLTLADFQKMQGSSAIAPILGASGGDQWAQNAYNHYKNGGYGSTDSEALQNIDAGVQQAGGGSGITDNVQLAQNDASNTPGFGAFNHEFDANDLNANLAPNYQFMLDQGMGQTRNAANSTQGVVSGNALQGLNTYAQNYAKNAYQDAFSNFQTNKTNIFNRLSALAGIGQTANSTTAQYGTAATSAANNYLTSGAAAQAAGTVGSANAISGTLSNLGDLAYMKFNQPKAA